jgi:hypothetical protein
MAERQTRKNESLILTKLGTISEDVAVIKNEQQNTNAHLKQLNSKVAIQEGRQQASDSSVALITQTVASLQRQVDANTIIIKDSEIKKLTFWERNADKLFWLVAAGVFAILFAKFQ